jgi:hypothetical protein
MEPDRITIYIALAVVGAGIAVVTGPSPALLTLAQVVIVVELINRIPAPGDRRTRVALWPGTPKGE